MFGRIKIIAKMLKGSLKQAIKEGMKVGKNVQIGGDVNFGSEPYLITLHDNVRISSDVLFITHDGGNFAFRHRKEYKNVNRFGKIEIESYSFIGARVTIMPGVHVGKNCVIGAGSLVTKSVPDNSVVCGVPAKIICSTEEYAEKMKNRMPEKWDVDGYKANKKEYLLEIIQSPIDV